MREQIKLSPQYKFQLLMLKAIVPRVIHTSVLVACVYFAVFNVPFSSIQPTLVNQGFSASLGDRDKGR